MLKYVLGVASLALCCVPAAAQNDDAEQAAIENYAETYSVSAEEAERRLDMLREISRTHRSLMERFPNSYAGIYVVHRPDFEVRVKMTGNGQGQLAQVTDNPAFKVEQAARPVQQSRQIQNRIGKALQDAGIRYESNIGIEDEIISFNVLDRAKAEPVVARFLEQYDFVTLSQIAELPSNGASFYGGQLVSGAGGTCTTGFTAKVGSVEGVLTAGHCSVTGRETFTINGNSFSIYKRRYENSDMYGFDMMFLTRSGQTYPNQIYYDSGLRGSITSSDYWTPENWPVCSYGVQTNRRKCGTVNGVYLKLTDDKGITGMLMRAVTNDGTAFMQQGDSGGPVYSGGEATGLMKGFVGNTLYFVQIWDASVGMGADVKIAP